jgi:RNA polymerase sigma-70 factor (ECF subfamily)
MGAKDDGYVRPDETATFGQTNWLTVEQAGAPGTLEADAARNSICQAYWYPVYFYIRRLGHSPEDAQDFTQAFFAKLFEKNYLQSADRGKGKFRSFLLTMVKRFLADEWDRANRLKRGGGKETISIDQVDTEFRYRAEPADDETPEKAFERRWAEALLETVLKRLEEEYTLVGKTRIFMELKPFLTSEQEESCAEVAERLKISESNVKVTIHRLRQRCRDLLRAEIARTASSPALVDEEIQDLFAALRRN